MIALDTNVLVNACDKGEPAKQEKALALIEGADDGVLLWQVACEFVSTSRKQRLQAQGFTPAHAWARLAELLDLFRLVLPAAGVLDGARVFHLEKQVSYWDALILAACIEAGVERLYSEDVPGQDLPNLEIINPFA